jgi:SAM-dependent methyltransferase
MDPPSAQYLERRPTDPHRARWDQAGWFIVGALRRALAAHIGRMSLPPAPHVLDYGCASQPYRSLLPADARYVGADLHGNAAAQVHVDAAGRLPAELGNFDLVLSTQVLEHVEDPAAYVAECRRVLKPGGRLLLSTHGLWIYHRDPIDLWRWTSDGLKYLVQREGLEVEQVEGVMGLAAVAVQLFQDATYWHLPRWLRRLYGFLMQRLVWLFDRMHSAESRVRNAMVYVIVARRRD